MSRVLCQQPRRAKSPELSSAVTSPLLLQDVFIFNLMGSFFCFVSSPTWQVNIEILAQAGRALAGCCTLRRGGTPLQGMLRGRAHTVSYKHMKCKRSCFSSFLPEVWEAGGVWGEREEKQAYFRHKVVTWVWYVTLSLHCFPNLAVSLEALNISG